MSRNRKALLLRDVNICDLNDNKDRIPLGGLTLTPGITNIDFRQMLDILLVFSADLVVQNEHGDEVLRDDKPLLPGDYTVVANEVIVNNEIVYTRVSSIATGARVQEFTDAVRARDGRCVVSKVINLCAEIDEWIGFEAVHIFPLAYESYGRWITIDPSQGGKINLVQNSILLRSHLLSILIMDIRSFTLVLIWTNRVETSSIVAYSTTHAVRWTRSSAGISARPSFPT